MVLISFLRTQMDKTMLIEDYKICLSIQRALLDKITRNLRRVSFLIGKNVINVYFFYDGEPSEIEKELVGDASAEIIADFQEPFKINCELINMQYPKKIMSKGRIIFNRFE